MQLNQQRGFKNETHRSRSPAALTARICCCIEDEQYMAHCFVGRAKNAAAIPSQELDCFAAIFLLSAASVAWNRTCSRLSTDVKSFQLNFLASSGEPDSDISSPGSQDVLILPSPKLTKMNRNQRNNYALRTLKSLADNLADCEPDVFMNRLSFLEDLNTCWLSREVTANCFDADDLPDPSSSKPSQSDDDLPDPFSSEPNQSLGDMHGSTSRNGNGDNINASSGVEGS